MAGPPIGPAEIDLDPRHPRRPVDVDQEGAAGVGRLVGRQSATGRFRAGVGPTNDNVEEMLEQVAEGRAVRIVPASMASFYGRPDLHWIPIDDVEPLRVALAWMQPGSLLVDEFAASAASSSSDEFGRRSRRSRE